MSKTIDEKVVEMRFDNKQFEAGVATTMSSLDNLKKSLKFEDSYKGLDKLGSAADKVNMSGLSGAVETVKNKFSALEIMGVTALANITNSAVNAGKRIVSSLTIQPVTTGFNEYELKMGSIQTIMAGTGESLETVNKYLNELNEYSDKTIYSFSDMTQNIGKFTNAGVKLEDAVLAIKGVSNEAAVSGANANEASRAMYNFAQALSAGYVKLIDWKSIENANMATMEFKQQLIDTAVELGTLAETADGMYYTGKRDITAVQNFNDSLQDQWMTTDVLIGTLRKYADANTEIGKKAYAAAQDVKTFSMMMDTLKEAAQSGWATTWELLVGDYEQAKSMFTKLSEFFGNIIAKTSDFRNKVVESALGKTFAAVVDGISESLTPITQAAKMIDGVTESCSDLNEIVRKVINGSMGNGVDRVNNLTSAGYNYYLVQNKVNEALGSSFRYSEKLIESAGNLSKSVKKSTETTKEETKEASKLTKAQKEQLITMSELSDEQLRANGYSETQISNLRALQNGAEKLGLSFDYFLDKIEEINGRWILIDTFKNIGNSISSFAKIITDAWKTIFYGSTDTNKAVEKNASALYNFITALHKFSTELTLNEKASNNFKRIFEGAFAGFQLVTGVIKMSLTTAVKLLDAVFKLFGTDILSVAAYLADYIVKLRDWVKENTFIVDGVNKVAEVIKLLIERIHDCAVAIIDLDKAKEILSDISGFFKDIFGDFDTFSLKNVTDALTKAFDGIENWIKGMKDSDNIVSYIITGIIDGIKRGIIYVVQEIASASKTLVGNVKEKIGGNASGIGTNIISGVIKGITEGLGKLISSAVEIGSTIINSVKDVLGIHSPSKVFIAIGLFIVAGLAKGLKDGFPSVLTSFRDMFSGLFTGVTDLVNNLYGFLQNIDFGSMLAAGFGIGTLVIVKQFLNIADKLVNPFDKLGGLFKSGSNVLDAFADSIKAKKWERISNILLNAAKAIAIVAAAIILLTKIDNIGKAWEAVGLMAAISAILVGLAFALSKFSEGANIINVGKLAVTIISIGIAMALLAGVAKKLKGITWDEYKTAAAGMVFLEAMIVGLLAATRLAGGAKRLAQVGPAILKIAVAMALLTMVAKTIAKMEWSELGKAAVGIAFLGLVVTGLIKATTLAGNKIKSVGIAILSISAAMMILALTAKMIAGMSWEEFKKAAVGILFLTVIVEALVVVAQNGGGDLKKVGAVINSVGLAFLMMAVSARIIGGMKLSSLVKAGVAIGYFSAIIIAMIKATNFANGGENLKKVGATILAVSAAIMLLSIATVFLGAMKVEDLAKGLVVISILALLVKGLIAATKGATDCKGSIIAITAAIAVMVIAVASLAMIDPQKLATSTLAVSMLIGMFALILKASSGVKASFGSVVLMLGVVMLLSSVIKEVAKINAENVIKSATALSELLLAVSASFAILSIIGKVGKDTILGIAMLTAFIAPLFAFVAVLAAMQNVQNAISNATALAGLAVVLSMLLVPLSLIGVAVAASGGITLLGLVALTAMAVPLLAFVGVLAVMNNISSAEKNVNLLITLTTSMSKLLVALSILSPFIITGLATFTLMTGFMLALGGLATVIGFITDRVPFLKKFLATGVPVLIFLADALGTIVGKFIGGIAVGISSDMPKIATNLSTFMNNLSGFVTGSSKIGNDISSKIKSLAAAILVLTGTDVLTKLASLVTGKSSLPKLGTELGQFMTNVAPFVRVANSMKMGFANNVKNLAEAIKAITSANIFDSLSNFLPGDKTSLSTFGSNLGDLGKDFKAFADNLGTFDDDKVKSVKSASNAIKALAEAAEELPNEGGTIAKLFGDNSISEFGSKLPELGTNLKGFVTNLGTFSNTETVDAAGKAIISLADAASKIPNEGGAIAALLGDNGLAAFGDALPNLGTNIASFVTNLGSIDDSGAVECAGNIITSLATMADDLPNSGGFWQKIFGEGSIAAFGDDLPGLAESIRSYVDNLGSLSMEQVSAVNASCNIIRALGALSNDGADDIDSNLEDIGKVLDDFSEDLSEFVETMYGVANYQISSAISKINSIIDMVKTVSGVDFEPFKQLGTTLQTVGQNGISGFVTEVTSKTSEEKATEALASMVTAIGNTAKSKATTAGRNLGIGYINGMLEKKTDVYSTAYSLGQRAVKGLNDGQDSHSPSKESEQSGKWFGEGMIIGIDKMGSSVYSAGYEIGRKAVKSLSKSIANISSLVDSDLDLQPTIRPVVDLSGVKEGVNGIDNLLNSSAYSGAIANTRAIGAMVNGRSTTSNDDVVSAIEDLGRKVNSNPTNTYNINGITYDDGSNISSAVEALVRAARIERRV